METTDLTTATRVLDCGCRITCHYQGHLAIDWCAMHLHAVSLLDLVRKWAIDEIHDSAITPYHAYYGQELAQRIDAQMPRREEAAR